MCVFFGSLVPLWNRLGFTQQRKCRARKNFENLENKGENANFGWHGRF